MKCKSLIITLLLMITYSAHGQYQGVYVSEYDKDIFVVINKNNLEVRQTLRYIDDVEDVFHQITLIESEYKMTSDTIFFTENNRTLSFIIINKDILQLNDSLNRFIDTNTKFYCTRKRADDGRILYFGKWKDGQRDSSWLFFDKDRRRFVVEYDRGKEVRRYNLEKR